MVGNYIKPWLNKEEHLKRDCEDVHHILPTSRLGANIDQNKIRLYHNLHMAYHAVFGNGTPIENLKQHMNIIKKSMTLEIQHDLFKILNANDDEYYYKDGIYLHK